MIVSVRSVSSSSDETEASANSGLNWLIANELNLPPVKLHCSMLAEDAIKAALKDYKLKKDTPVAN